MSSWIKADFNFKQHGAILVIGRRQADEVLEIVKEFADTPDELEKALRAIIERSRPELANVNIWHMSYSPSKMAWEVFVEHPSLPAKAMYEMATELPLIPTTVKDLKEMVDTTLRNYIKAGDAAEPWMPKKAVLADESLWDDEAIRTAMAGNADKAIVVGAKE